MPEPLDGEPREPRRDAAVAEIWHTMIALVVESRDPWRREVVALTGMPFSRIRILRRVAGKPMTLTHIAAGVTMDPPAASVAVSELEAAGLVRREPSPTDRRRKNIHITDAGRHVLSQVASVPDPAPAELTSATAAQLETLRQVLLRDVAGAEGIRTDPPR